ncbi:Protein of unknown function [Lactobacillus helveticus CIRM-BIA 101]|nr:Protein of unknown function [Lactobacillus helveticus CIRM-BIA 101]
MVISQTLLFRVKLFYFNFLFSASFSVLNLILISSGKMLGTEVS